MIEIMTKRLEELRNAFDVQNNCLQQNLSNLNMIKGAIQEVESLLKCLQERNYPELPIVNN
jgi:hypothetical protein